MSIRKWISLTNKAALYDDYGDSAIKSLLKYSIICFVLAFISIFPAAMFAPEIFVGTGLFVLTGIVLLVKRKNLLSKDINDYLRLFFVPLLKVFAQKAGEESKLAATLDFNIPTKKLQPVASKVRGRNLKLYQPKYIIAMLELLDGAILDFIVADDIKEFSWWKKSASGKSKYKTKSKFVHHAFIKMSVPKSEYILNSNNSSNLQVEESETTYIAKYKLKLKTEGKNRVLPLKHFFDAIQNIYSVFQPINALSKVPAKKVDEEIEDHSMAATGMAVYMWSGGYFDSYDYDSFDYSDSGSYDTDDDSATVFDS